MAHPVPRREWLALTAESAEEPDLPVIDPHHHLWDLPGNTYKVPEVLQDIASGHDVRSTVFVECGAFYRASGPEAMQPVGETEAVEAMASTNAASRPSGTAVAAGIVGHVDLTLGDAAGPVLDAHMVASSRFRGIRHIASFDESPMGISPPRAPRGLMLDPTFRKGFAQLGPRGLTFDAWQFQTQLPELASLARAFPAITIVVNHAGGVLGIGPYAGKRDEVTAQWRRGLVELAACPNVVIKLGGLGMPRSGFGWVDRPRPPTSDELVLATAPYYLTCIEIFGVDRCMFESNFPVDKQSYSYVNVWNSFKRMTRDFKAAERAALFHDTAERIYRLT